MKGPARMPRKRKHAAERERSHRKQPNKRKIDDVSQRRLLIFKRLEKKIREAADDAGIRY